MPVAVGDSGAEAFDTLCERLNSPAFDSSVGASEEDVAFLSGMMNSVTVQSLVQAHDTLETASMEPISCNNAELLHDINTELQSACNKPSLELLNIISNPHFQALLEAHDDIASKNYDSVPEVFPTFNPPSPLAPIISPGELNSAIRMVGIRKSADEPLGITVRRNSTGALKIARILAGSMIERQGLLHVGDIIKEINGQEVVDPDQLQEVMKRCSGSVTLKVLPTADDPSGSSEVFLKAHFSFDPKRDNLIPCRDAGLAFKAGDILEVVSMDDNSWWQARKVTDTNQPSGLIPSQTLEEKRKAFVKPEYDYTHKSLLCGLMTKKKRKMMYQSRKNADFDRTELLIYEEVTKMPPFQRKTLLLIGAPGIGRRTMKNRLIKADCKRFGSITPHTSRPLRDNEVDGENYWFMDSQQMEEEITDNRFLEYGRFEDNFYGTKFDSVRSVIESGRMCVLDINPQALKSIKTSEFMPFVVFISAPSMEVMRTQHEHARQRGHTDKIRTERDFRMTLDESKQIERQYRSFFDLTIVNSNMDATYTKLRQAIETLSTKSQWVPVSWVY